MSKIFVVGIGPGNLEDMTIKAKSVLENVDIIVGYTTYVNLIEEYFPNKEFITTGMTKEIDRCEMVLEKALEGKNVAIISSGDSGIYGMAGIMIEVVEKSDKKVDIEVIPGVTALSAGAAILGAPIMHDFAIISLSNLLTPLDKIYKRVESAAMADFVIGLYNPKSKTRKDFIGNARELVLKYQSENTPVGIVRNAGRKNQEYDITTLKYMLSYEINMFTIVIIGNSATYIKNGKIITPRGYEI